MFDIQHPTKCAATSHLVHVSCAPCPQLFRGLYAPYLRMWLRFLGVDNVLVLKSEDYFSDPDAGALALILVHVACLGRGVRS